MSALHDAFNIGLRGTLAGCVVLVVATVAGWGLGAYPHFPPVRAVSFWVRRVIIRALKKDSWTVRAGAIFLNNASICALIVAAGALPGGSWAMVTVVGFSMGVAMRVLGEETGWPPEEISPDARHETPTAGDNGQFSPPEADPSEDEVARPPALNAGPEIHIDLPAKIGFALNLVEIPAIVIVAGLSMGQLAAPNGLSMSAVWRIFAALVLPALALAAGGEALWIGRVRLFASEPAPRNGGL